MLLLRSYHDKDFLAISSFFSDGRNLSKDEQLRLKTILINNYVVVCEILGEIVGYAIFFLEQGHIFKLQAQNSLHHKDILEALLYDIEKKAKKLQITKLTLQSNSSTNSVLFQSLGFLKSKDINNLTKSLA